MLTAGGEEQFLGGIRGQAAHPIGQALGVEEFLGVGEAIGDFLIGILGVGGVKAEDCLGEPGGRGKGGSVSRGRINSQNLVEGKEENSKAPSLPMVFPGAV